MAKIPPKKARAKERLALDNTDICTITDLHKER